jgi:tetratricopeptide (TPR) repeat protein
MTGVSGWLEAGVRAYTRGALDEAERCWREALAQDPADPRAREYLAHLARRPPAASRPAHGAAAAPRRPSPTPPPASEQPAASGWDAMPARSRIDVPPQGGVDLTALGGAAAAPPPAPPGEAPAPAPPRLARQIAASMQRARELFALGDFSGSLELVERILAAAPGHPEALSYLRENEATLVAMYESKLGPLGAAPQVRARADEVLWLNLDHRAGFLLAQVDGATSWEDLFALSGLPRLETARILARLVEDGVIAPR